MPKERNKADGYREKAYEGDTKAMNNLGVCYERGTGVRVSLELASACIVCGQCQAACPQHLPIIGLLAEVAETLE